MFADNANDYEWQMRGYMMLWDCDTAIVDYCLVDTPEHLIGYEQRSYTLKVTLTPIQRVKVCFERDEQKSNVSKLKCWREKLQEYFELLKQRLKV